ncbi:MAG: MATE family efflux transporter [Fusobacteriaceae bacterium]
MKNNLVKDNLVKDNVWRLMIKYGIPSILTMWIFSFYTIVDGFFISKYIGRNGLAAVNIVMPFINFSFAVGIMIAVGGATIVGIKLGEKKNIEASRIFSLSVQLLAIFGVFLSVLGVFFSEIFVKFLGANSVILEDSKTYLFYISFFIVTYLLGYGLEIFIRVDGSPSYSLVCIIIGGIVNIFLDYFFIGVFNWGIKGAALATGIGQMSTLLPLIYYLKYKNKKLLFSRTKLKLKDSFQLMYNGSSEFLAEITTGIVIMSFNINIINTIGEIGVSVFGVISYFSTLITMTMIGFSQGIQPIISYNHGAKENKRIISVLKISMSVILLLGFFFYISINYYSYKIVSIFLKNNTDLIKLTENAIKYFSFTYLLMGINIFIGAYFTAIEKSFISSFLSILRGLIFINLFLYFLPKWFGLNGLWFSASLNEIVTAIFSIFIFSYFVMKENRKKEINEK